MEKFKLIRILVEDFKSMFPNFKSAEIKALEYRLSGLDLKDLKLLVSQVKKEK